MPFLFFLFVLRGPASGRSSIRTPFRPLPALWPGTLTGRVTLSCLAAALLLMAARLPAQAQKTQPQKPQLVVQTGHTNTVYSVCFSPDGTRLASGSLDHTIRLWDAATGQTLARLISLDQSDWAVVDPQGRFDASPGGMTLMHWNVGADVIAFSQLKDRYSEPGLLAKLLGFNKEPLRDVSAFDHVDLFPTLKVPSKVPGSGKLTLSLSNRGGGLGRVQVFVNGVELKADARGPGVNPNAPQATLTVDVSHAPSLVPGKQNTIRVVTWNKQGYLSSRGTEMVYTPRGQAQTAPPSLWAIVCGIDAYAGPELRLTYPDRH